MSPGFLPESCSALDTLSSVDSTSGRIMASYSSREISTSRCKGLKSLVTSASSRILTYGSKLSFFLASSAAHQSRAFAAGCPCADIDAVLLFELRRQALRQQIVEVVAAEVVVAVARQHLGDVAFHGHHRDVEGAAAEIVNQRRVPRSVAVAVSQAGGGGLVENAHHFQPGQRAGFARGVALRVRKVGGHGDHGLLRALAQRAVRPLRQFAQDQRGDLLRQKVLVCPRAPFPRCPSCA